MDKSKINQTQLDFSCGLGLARLNLFTGRLLYEYPGITIGANNFQIATSLIYNSHIKEGDFEDKKIGLGNGWKLNIQQYVFPYKVSYGLNGFKVGDYVYIDSNWNIHRFVKYKDSNSYVDSRDIYYDASGSGLRLITGPYKYSEIFDGSNSILRFNLQGQIFEIVSGVNAEIVKTIIYEGNNIKAVYDSRKANRRINFNYDTSGRLVKMHADAHKVNLLFNYSDSTLLDKVSKNDGNKSKDTAYLKYDNLGELSHIIDAQSLRVLYLEHDNSVNNTKITAVKEAAMKKQLITEELETELFIGDIAYIGDDSYFTDRGVKIKDYHLVMPKEYIKTTTTFLYETNYTDVKNDKNIVTRYYFNINGFTSSVLENKALNNKTLFKTGGWQLSSSGTSEYKINNQKANILTPENNYTYVATKTSNFLKLFDDYKNKEDSKYRYTENFVVSFWTKFSKKVSNDIIAVLTYAKKGIEYSEKTYIDKTLANSWQYVTIPINLGTEQESITSIKIEFRHEYSGSIIEIADMRIAIGNSTTIRFVDNSTVIDLKKATKFVYVENGLEKSETIDGDSFVEDSDLFSTYKSLYYKNQNDQATFDFVYCGGTKVKSISHLQIREGNRSVAFSIDSQGIPNYYTYSSSRNGEEQWSVTEGQIRFHKGSGKDYYYETKTAIQLLANANSRIVENKSARTYEWRNANGTMRAKKDEYAVVIAYHYDGYGNLTSTSIYNDNVEISNREYLNTIYNYGGVEERLRELPKSCEQNGIIQEVYYNEPNFTTNHTLNGESQCQYEYDSYQERVTAISNNKKGDISVSSKNTIKYDEFGRVKSVSDQSNRTYGFIYNVFGENLKYYENKRLVLEKEIIKDSQQDILIDKVYNQKLIDDKTISAAYETITKIDAQGRIISQTNKTDDTDIGNSITFSYQNIEESESQSKVLRIVDPYEGQEYNFTYDQENRPCKYTTTGNQNTGAKKMTVRQIGVGDTQYYFEDENEYIMSSVIKEDSEFDDGEYARYSDPRIRRTKYMKMDDKDGDKFDDNYKEFNFEYRYDNLGRLTEKNSEKIEHDSGVLYNKRYLNLSKQISYGSGKTLINNLNYIARSDEKNDTDDTKIEYENKYDKKYDKKGNITSIKESGTRYKENPVNGSKLSTSLLTTKTYNYTYDAFDRLTKEIHKEGYSSIKSTIVYDYSQTSDKLRSVSQNGTVVKKFTYENGRPINIEYNGESSNIDYDNYGNIIKDHKGVFRYNSRNLLDLYYVSKDFGIYTHSYENNYSYNYQGVRFRKYLKETITGMSPNIKYVNYYLDGSRIIGEDWININNNVSESMRYFYDAEGVCGLRYDGYNFNFIKNTLGNVTKVMYQSKVIGEYVYDAWGNSEVVELSIANDRDRFVLYNNPFRWKSHYLDLETGLYYVNGRYYSPVLMQYINADSIENISPSLLNSLNRHAITLDNSITYESNPDTIFTDTELHPDPTYDPLLKKTWWQLNWKKAIQWIAFALVLIVSLVLMCTPAAALGVGMFMAGLKAAVSGAIIGGLIGGIMSFIRGNSFMEGFAEGAVYGFINGFTTGALLYCAGQAITALSKASNARTKVPGQCFIAGTIVLTSIGNQKIENIKVGDKVWAYDEETGEKALKEVVRLFRNESKLRTTLSIKAEDGTVDKIVSTPGHKYYLPDNNRNRNADEILEHASYEGLSDKWVSACDLKKGDKVLLSDGKYGIIISVKTEKCEKFTTYNFEVADFHTYYVGEQGILVHNACVLDELGVKNFNEVGSKYTPDQLIDKLDDLGFSKTVEAARSTTSGPATFMNRGGLEFRIMSSPANGNAYFRVMNAGRNYLGANAQVINNLAGKAYNLATHFYF